MSSEFLALAILVLFIALILMRVPIAFSLGSAGLIGLILLDGFDVALLSLAATPYGSSAKYAFVVIPLFVFMGVLIAETGIAADIFNAAHRVLGKLPGGLGIATVAASALFGAVSGSSTATAATLGRVSMSSMTRFGYPAPFAGAIIAVAGTLAVLIPPSIILVMYGVITGESIGSLLLAGVLPGILSAVALAAYIFIWAKTHARNLVTTDGSAVATSPTTYSTTEVGLEGSTQNRKGLMGVVYVMILFLIVMGSIYTGFATATEAASLGVLGAVILGLLHLRRQSGTTKKFVQSLRETATVTGMLFAILLGGTMFTIFLVSTGVPQDITGWIVGLDVPPFMIVAFVILLMIPLGMVLDGLSMMVITVPLTYPVVTALGFDGIWFGVLVVIAFEIGLITPPVGLNVYVIGGLKGAPSTDQIFNKVWGFVLLQLGIVAVLFIFPEIVTWLPGLA